MKVFIATFYKNNYGSALQAIALSQKIEELGGEPIIVEYKNKETQKNLFWKTISFFRPEKHYGPIRKIKRYIQRKIYIEKSKKINQFLKSKVTVLPYETVKNDMENSECLLLAGSDQVWSILNHPIDNFYLFADVNNPNAHRVSYAASIGISNLSVEQKLYYKNVLAKFETVSFREFYAYDNLKEDLCNPTIRQDIDPTLLFPGEYWEKMTKEKKHTVPYLFIYMLRPSKAVIKIARKLAKEKNLDIIYMGLYANNYRGITTIVDAGVEDFLSYIKYADVVVTNSFHGTVFSVLFKKCFVSVKISSTSSRVENLLEIVDLSNHLITDISEAEVAYEVYDSERIEKKLDEKRNESIDYLKKLMEF